MAGFLHELSGPDAARILGDGATVIVPVGAIEQHGPHLPLGVDHIIADAAARAVVEQLGNELDVWVAPTLPYSKSNEHAWSAGTVWLSSHTMHRVIADMASSLAFSGVRRLVFLNGHGGNSTILNTACREVRLAEGLLTFLLHAFVPPAYAPLDPDAGSDAEMGMGIHGGRDETSVMLHLRPDLVEMSKAVRNIPEWMASNEHVKFGGSVQFGWLSNDFGADGHIGDPTVANIDLGARLFGSAVDFLCDQLREIVSFDFTG